MASSVPDGLVLKHHRDLESRRLHQWIRRGLVALLAAFLVAGLLNVFGQKPATTTVRGSAADLELYAPKRLRSGLYYEVRFTIRAHRELKKATLVLDPGWLEGMTLNTVEPAPIGEASRDGRLVFELGHVPRGDEYTLFLQFQVNPTNVGYRPQDVDLLDGDSLVLHLDRSITVFP